MKQYPEERKQAVLRRMMPTHVHQEFEAYLKNRLLRMTTQYKKLHRFICSLSGEAYVGLRVLRASFYERCCL